MPNCIKNLSDGFCDDVSDSPGFPCFGGIIPFIMGLLLGKGWMWHMRRAMLLIMGFGTAMALLTVLIGNMLTQTYPSKPVQPALAVQTDHVYTAEQVETLEAASLTLPCAVPNTTLVAEHIVQYEGGFLEDGSNDEVVNIVGLVLHNTGDEMIHSAKVILERGGLQLCFRATYIPPKTSMLVLESERKQCLSQNFTDCYGWQKCGQENWVEQENIKMEPINIGTLCLTNIGEKTLYDMTFYYKNYLEYSEMYVGGITNRCAVGDIAPGETVEVSPYHYAHGYSKVLGVTAE